MIEIPWSAAEGKTWIRDRVLALLPNTLLDIGPGAGAYSDLLKPLMPWCKLSAIEVFEPYVERFDLHSRYDHVTVADVTTLDTLPTADVVILGDVLEHVTEPQAHQLWRNARQAATQAVFLSIPVVDYPQGESEGNPHEAHLTTWTHDQVMRLLPGIVDHAVYTEIGVYQAQPA